MGLPPLEALLRIGAVMVPTVLLCAWILREGEIFGPRRVFPPPPKLKPRKRPTDQGPETIFADRLPPR